MEGVDANASGKCRVPKAALVISKGQEDLVSFKQMRDIEAILLQDGIGRLLCVPKGAVSAQEFNLKGGSSSFSVGQPNASHFPSRTARNPKTIVKTENQSLIIGHSIINDKCQMADARFQDSEKLNQSSYFES